LLSLIVRLKMKTATSIILTIALASMLSANELCTKIHGGLEQADGSYSDLWRLTVEPQEGQLVLATFWIDVDEELDTTGIPRARKIETIHYAPDGLHAEKVECVEFPNEGRTAVDGLYYKKWIVSGFGKEIKFSLDPMFRVVSAGGSFCFPGGITPPKQSARRRFRFADRKENPTKKFRFVLSLETIEFWNDCCKLF